MPNDLQPSKKKLSKLIPAGIILIALGLFAPGPIDQMADTMRRGSMEWKFALIATDLLRVCFFLGFIPLIIGFIRERSSKQTVSTSQNS